MKWTKHLEQRKFHNKYEDKTHKPSRRPFLISKTEIHETLRTMKSLRFFLISNKMKRLGSCCLYAQINH